MKNIFSYAMMSIAAIAAFTSCADDRDSNPTLTQPTTFVLNNPEVGTGVVDLEKSTSFDLTWSQPTEYTTMNAPVVATYTIQLSSKGTFNQEYLESNEDNTGADFISLDETSTTCVTTVETDAVAKKLQLLNDYPEDEEILSQPLYIRVKSAVLDASQNAYNPIVSNVVNMNILPYYVELQDATPIMWYLVGNMFGGKWGSDIGETALPMFLKDGYEYNKKDGSGEIEYLNWFGTGEYSSSNENGDYGWKIQPSTFDWNYGFGGGQGKYDQIVYRAGGDDGGHIMPSEAGVYLVTVNTAKNTAKMEKYEGTVTDYGTIQISGGMNSWGDTPMLPYNKEGVENHAWYYILECSETTEFKFKIEGSWDTNWGSNTFPTGIGTNNGANISVEPGKWCVSFNDITGAYSIVSLE